jgi:hypothetical protein
VTALAALVLWLAWRSRSWPLVHDAPIMHYIAWRILDGAAPYRDLFDMNFPGVYLFHIAVVRLLGAGDVAWRAAELAVTALSALAVALLAAPWGRTAALGGGLFFAAYHLASGAWNAGQRDFLLCPFLLAGALGVTRWAETGRLAPVLGGGIALGAGLTIKPHAIVLVAVLAAFVGVWAHRAKGSVLAPLATFIGGAAIAPAGVVAWVAALGALGAWRDIVFGYLVPLYSRLNRPSDWMYFRWQPWLLIAPVIVLALARVALTRRFTARHAVVALGLGYGLVHFLGQRKGWEYHLYPLAAFAAVLVFAELRPALAARRPVAAPLAAALAAVIWLLGVKGVEAADAGWIAYKERRVSALAEDLARRTTATERVHVLDTTEGALHALLRQRLRTPTRFLYDFHFFHHEDAPMIARLRAELVDGLAAQRPPLIVLCQYGWPAGGYERIERFPALHDLLRTRYRLDREGPGYRIYAKRHDP